MEKDDIPKVHHIIGLKEKLYNNSEVHVANFVQVDNVLNSCTN